MVFMRVASARGHAAFVFGLFAMMFLVWGLLLLMARPFVQEELVVLVECFFLGLSIYDRVSHDCPLLYCTSNLGSKGYNTLHQDKK